MFEIVGSQMKYQGTYQLLSIGSLICLSHDYLFMHQTFLLDQIFLELEKSTFKSIYIPCITVYNFAQNYILPMLNSPRLEFAHQQASKWLELMLCSKWYFNWIGNLFWFAFGIKIYQSITLIQSMSTQSSKNCFCRQFPQINFLCSWFSSLKLFLVFYLGFFSTSIHTLVELN